MDDDFAVVDLIDIESVPFPESGLLHRKLTESLGCTDMRVNAVSLDPGQETTAHSHERQEEVYVALDGGHVRVNETVHSVEPAGVVRIGPEAVRSVLNRSSGDTQTWIMFGAPTAGTIEDYGEYRLPED